MLFEERLGLTSIREVERMTVQTTASSALAVKGVMIAVIGVVDEGRKERMDEETRGNSVCGDRGNDARGL